jgi:hypothetical protein
MEIKKADEFAKLVVMMGYSSGPNGIEYPGADLIRSRDKAIIERCKEVLQEMRENGDHDMRQAICRVDSILRDLS